MSGLGSLARETAQLTPQVVPTAGLEHLAIEGGSTVVGPLENLVAGDDLGRELDTDLKFRSAILKAGPCDQSETTCDGLVRAPRMTLLTHPSVAVDQHKVDFDEGCTICVGVQTMRNISIGDCGDRSQCNGGSQRSNGSALVGEFRRSQQRVRSDCRWSSAGARGGSPTCRKNGRSGHCGNWSRRDRTGVHRTIVVGVPAHRIGVVT